MTGCRQCAPWDGAVGLFGEIHGEVVEPVHHLDMSDHSSPGILVVRSRNLSAVQLYLGQDADGRHAVAVLGEVKGPARGFAIVVRHS